jgi:alpha-L-rhamnosidase
LGSCGQWLFDTIAGIGLDPRHPGFRHIIIAPHVGGGLTSAAASFRSIRGPIRSSWSIKDGGLVLEIVIPTNTTATVHVPAASVTAVMESGKPAIEAEGVKLLRAENGSVAFEVQSGTYLFTVK